MLNLDLSRALDPLAFAADCGLPEPDPWQSDLLMGGARKSLLLCARHIVLYDDSSQSALRTAGTTELAALAFDGANALPS